MVATEPLNKNDILRPRLSKLEVEVITACIEHFINAFNGSKLDRDSQQSLKRIKRLHKRFEYLSEGNKFLRPRSTARALSLEHA